MKKKDEPVVVRFSKLAGNTVVSNVFIDEIGPEFGATAGYLYVCLCRFANWDSGRSYPSLKTLGTMTGLSRPTIIKVLKKFEDEGLILLEKVKAQKYFRNEYVLLAPEEWKSDLRVKLFNTVRVKQLNTNSSVEQNSKEPLMIPQGELAGSNVEEFVWEKYLDSMKENPNRAIKIIRRYFLARGIEFDSSAKVREAIGRHVRYANKVKAWSNDEIDAAIEKLQDCKFDWTLESVWKTLTK